MHRHVRGIGEQTPFGIEQGTGEIQPFLDIHAGRCVPQDRAHPLCNRHEHVVEQFQQDRIRCRIRRQDFPWFRSLPCHYKFAPLSHDRLPAAIDHTGAGLFGDERRAVNPVARDERVALVKRSLTGFSCAMHADCPG